MEREDLIYTVALNRALRYNGKVAKELIDAVESAKAVFELSARDLKELFGKEYTFFNDILRPDCLREAQEEIEWAASKGITILCSEDPSSGYPEHLLEYPDFPLILYKLGEAPLHGKRFVSIVGTRRSTPYGQSVCTKIVEELSRIKSGATIVSGLAYGIDITAHSAALENGLSTVAVMAAGLDNIYPAAHTQYAREIISKGALISEFPRGSESLKVNFLRRNRIIAGLSEATIVVESGERGGSMITASLVCSYSKELFAVPGRVSDSSSQGCNLLIANNMASIYCNIAQFTNSLGWNLPIIETQTSQKELFPEPDGEKEKILLALTHNPDLDIDQLAIATGYTISELSRLMLELQLEGRVLPQPGKRYAIK
ncbi:MAG: DNA-processing protein DprA [Bacteroidales bacterium]|jgi:DNA processing protein|nr:DNA-processing protein DprA [Bacteroidales bacterium]